MKTKKILEHIEKREAYLQEVISSYSIPKFSTGDIISVRMNSSFSSKKKQSFVGVCISIKNKGLRSSFVLRNMIDGNGIECFFPTYSPMINQIQVLKKKRTRASKLYYTRKKEHYTSV